MMPQDTAEGLRVFSLGAANKGNKETSFRQVSWMSKDSQDRQTKREKRSEKINNSGEFDPGSG